MRLAASQDLHPSILHSQESVVQPTHVLTLESLHLGSQCVGGVPPLEAPGVKPQDRATKVSLAKSLKTTFLMG
ncbi:hypothetical protein [Scytonema sp. HK-05]|uniref:hypothetical protein n=1 Tax=Scytonema sp. HK-05 TaxID=1137095 RepID=UPI0018E97FDF|nr:hypothetical protein [Scytonema sp. HK-05]